MTTDVFDTIMNLPEEIFDESKVTAEIPSAAYNDTLGHTEDISEQIALQLIGENQRKPHCVYKMISTATHTCITQFDLSKDPSDPDYATEYELEEYKEGYKPGIDEASVSSGFWQAQDTPKRINTMAIVAVVFILLFIVGVAGIALLLSWT